MPLSNRVTPFGSLQADPARGTLLGVRGGMFHDPVTRTLTGRRWVSRRWLCCRLDYPGTHRHPVWSRGYTQLFFLDEVTALAAGHRPCAECRRAAAKAFQAAAGGPATLEHLDRQLHAERLDGRVQRRWPGGVADDLPDGAMYAQGECAFAKRGHEALPWSPTGYGRPSLLPGGTLEVLTPPTTLAALRAGYRPAWHPSAGPLTGTGSLARGPEMG